MPRRKFIECIKRVFAKEIAKTIADAIWSNSDFQVDVVCQTLEKQDIYNEISSELYKDNNQHINSVLCRYMKMLSKKQMEETISLVLRQKKSYAGRNIENIFKNINDKNGILKNIRVNYLIANTLEIKLFDNFSSINKEERLRILLLIEYFKDTDYALRNFRAASEIINNPRRFLVGIPSTVPSETKLIRNYPARFINYVALPNNSMLYIRSLEINAQIADIENDDGFLRTELKKFSQSIPHNALTTAGKNVKWLQANRRFYGQQYEYATLLSVLITFSENVLRNIGEFYGIQQKNIHDLMKKLKATNVFTPYNDIIDLFEKIFSPTELNLRNKVMHGGFFRSESERVEMLFNKKLFIDSPKNVKNYCRMLIFFINSLLKIYPSSLSATTWQNKYLYTQNEEIFLRKLKYDFLTSDALDLVIQMKNMFNSDEIPSCFSTPIKFGTNSSFYCRYSFSFSFDLYFNFSSLCISFEAIFRSILLSHGVEIYTAEKHRKISCRYKMLDTDGLIDDNVMRFLTKNLKCRERIVARKTILLAVKARNAFAHGATLQNFDQKLLFLYSHAITKTILLFSTI